MKFEVGEFAIVAFAPAFPEVVGKIIVILGIEPSYVAHPYKTDFRGWYGNFVYAADRNLRKLPPREEPESITRHEECEA